MIKTIWIWQSTKKIRYIWIAAMLLIFSGCLPSETPVTTIFEWGVCDGWDEMGRPVGFSKLFSGDQPRIIGCGRIESDSKYPRALSIFWFLENGEKRQVVFRDIVVVETDGYFYSIFRPADMANYLDDIETPTNFLPGNYNIEVVFGNVLVRTAEFQIE